MGVCTCTRTGLHSQMQPTLRYVMVYCVCACVCVYVCVSVDVCVCVCVWTMCVQGFHVLICGCN